MAEQARDGPDSSFRVGSAGSDLLARLEDIENGLSATHRQLSGNWPAGQETVETFLRAGLEQIRDHAEQIQQLILELESEVESEVTAGVRKNLVENVQLTRSRCLAALYAIEKDRDPDQIVRLYDQACSALPGLAAQCRQVVIAVSHSDRSPE